ncbi:MAG TPA: metal-dependent hydrolase [Rhodanobacteraceae bacterium]|nr:metal-dependent hydrolase [Rhodanobacteraceae bacterium]
MDPLSHAAFGRVLIGAAGERETGRAVRGTIAAAMLGALSPDLDSMLMPFGWDRYLRGHEIGTHTILGTIVCALATAAVVRLFTRSRYAPLLLAGWLGASSHVLLDLLSSARLRPGWPIVDTVVSLPVVAMADPYLLTLCVGGAVAARFAGTRRASRAMLGAIAAFVAAKAVAGAIAFQGYAAERDRSGQPVLARAIEAEWASLAEWRVIDGTAAALRVWQARAGDQARLVLTLPRTADDPLVASSRRLSTVRNFLRAHELVFAGVLPRNDGPTAVLWSDIRFCWDPDRPGAAQLEPVVRSGGTRVACALWFGGEFDATGAAVREIVRVGGFTQSRRAEITTSSRR